MASGPAPTKPDSRQWSPFDRGAAFFLLGLILALVLIWLAWGLAGAGHGPALFLAIAVPGLLFWPAAGASLAFAHRRFGRWVFPALVSISDLISLDVVTSISRADASYLSRAWNSAPEIILAFTAIFLIGHAALWSVYVIKRWKAANRSQTRGRITILGAMMALVVLALLFAIVAIPARSIIIQQHADKNVH